MKRDMDLVRTILLYVEENARLNQIEYIAMSEIADAYPEVSQFDQEDLDYHHKILVEAGYLTEVRAATGDGSDLGLLTWEGHEFLDKVRDPKIWRTTKSKAKAVGSWSVSILGEIAAATIKAELSKLGVNI